MTDPASADVHMSSTPGDDSPRNRRTFLCRLGFHDHRDENGEPLPDWYAFHWPHRYACTRCGNVRTLTPKGWNGA